MYFAFDSCRLILYHPSLEVGEGAEGNPGADLHPTQYQHPYTRKSASNLSGVRSLFAGLQLPPHPAYTHFSPAAPSGVHSLFVGLPIVATSLLANDLPHISIRHLRCSLVNTTSTSSNVNLPGCILLLPIRFGPCPFETSLPSCAISADDPRAPLDLWTH